MNRRSAGFFQLIPVLIVIFVAVSVLALSMEPKPQKSISTAVLSESETSGGHGGDVPKTSGPDLLPLKPDAGSTEIRKEIRPLPIIRPLTSPRPKETERPHNEVKNEIEHQVEVHEGTETASLRIGKREDKFTFEGERFGAESEFPVNVDEKTHELSVETPDGPRIVNVLPDKAVENVLGQNSIDRVLGSNGQTVEIKVDDKGNTFYEISGAKDKKFLGFFSVMVPKTLKVSTETGDVTNIDQDPLSQFLDVFSF